MKKIIALLLVSVLALGMCLTGCGQEDTPKTTVAAAAGTEATEDEIVIGVSMHCASSFFDGVIEGVEAYVAENGGRIINVDGRSDANYQMGVIEDFIAQGVDAVVYCPVDSIAATPALKLLKNAGIPVINIDSAVDAYDMIDAFVATDNYEAGKIAGEALVKNDPDGGKVAILDYPINEAAVSRANGFADAIKDHGFEVVAQLEAGVTPEKGMSVAEDVIQAHPDLSAIFVICDDSAQGAYAAIKSSGLNIPLYSVNGLSPRPHSVKTVLTACGSARLLSLPTPSATKAPRLPTRSLPVRRLRRRSLSPASPSMQPMLLIIPATGSNC